MYIKAGTNTQNRIILQWEQDIWSLSTGYQINRWMGLPS